MESKFSIIGELCQKNKGFFLEETYYTSIKKFKLTPVMEYYIYVLI